VAENECFIEAAPERVFSVLADAHSYERWVVGAQAVRHADASWPDVDSHLYHSVGIGPVTLKDNTKVVVSEPPSYLHLEARGRPFGIAHVEFDVAADHDGSRVRLREYVVRPRFLAALNPLFAPLVGLRNAKSLRRLTDVVMDSTPPGHF
jgi:carbon monoxide dehydrogenase subunit G